MNQIIINVLLLFIIICLCCDTREHFDWFGWFKKDEPNEPDNFTVENFNLLKKAVNAFHPILGMISRAHGEDKMQEYLDKVQLTRDDMNKLRQNNLTDDDIYKGYGEYLISNNIFENPDYEILKKYVNMIKPLVMYAHEKYNIFNEAKLRPYYNDKLTEEEQRRLNDILDDDQQIANLSQLRSILGSTQ